MLDRYRRALAALALGISAAALALFPHAALAADPLRIGFSISATGPTSPAGKQVLAGLEIWRADVNKRGGLLGRPVEFVYYDDQGNPANAPGIYAKLMSVDKVDLLIGPYSTNVIAATMPAIIQANRTTIGILRSRRQQGIQVSALFFDEFAGAGNRELLEMRVRPRRPAEADA